LHRGADRRAVHRARPRGDPHRALVRGAGGGGPARSARDVSALDVRIVKRLPGFTLDVAWTAGDGVAVLFGPSGAGKTLTLQCLAGLLRPDEGRIVVDGRLLFEAGRQARAPMVDLPPQARRV